MAKPTHEFYMPSVYDGTRLSTRIYRPSESDLQQPTIKGAIIAHPYATLGGSNDDPVVCSAAAELVRKGYVVLTLNFRGASDSGGQTSWTGKPELCDYISAYGFILKYLQLLAPSKPVELVLGGYSYGSMMVYHQPKVEDVVSLFASPKSGSLASELFAKARELLQGENKDENNNQEDTESELPLATISYLILSPVLSLASGLITLWSNLSRVSIQGKQLTTPPPEEQLPKHRTLVVYGTDDMFTSVKSFQQWTAKLSNSPDSQVRSVEIPFAGHFWLEQNFHAQLRKTISTWLDDAQ
ncbi:uncharacterized protein TRUGW13939_00796 [Talaromyces rugulosus]|uniref:Xaa-Pro dipeptidyl-peptidase-like domain-containing protein n=1 Tax=Talaromyces rugulosus TaxID=121627 RepID=A0A7H8QII4_TALRU|nr:uncharacterized protein TRUGW13939_00796 [Talaromyces rugulosus]QKX53716.1 hypothetical protein TRUGW13939_00796 [Talaromyces rugulosus]